MGDSIEEQVRKLNERMQRLEDESAIHRLIVRYGLAVDAGEPEAAMELFTKDMLYEVRNPGPGWEKVRGKR